MRPVPDPPASDPRRSDKADFAADLASAGASDSPPPEVSAEVREAARAAARLHELGRELRFSHGEDGKLRVELRDRSGKVLRSVAPTEVFDFAAGRVTA